MQTHMDAALKYAELGFRVFPCVVGGKEPACEHGCLDATTDEEKITAWWTVNPLFNVAVSTDGLCIVDVDPAGKPWLSSIRVEDLMRGTITKTPRDGLHYWMRQNGTPLRNTTSKLAVGIDTRANGGYVLVPPSQVNGRKYEWVTELEAEQPLVPGWLVELLDVRRPLSEASNDLIPEGSRNTVLIRHAGYFRRIGMDHEEIKSSLLAINSKRCKPELPEREIAMIAKSACRYPPDDVEEALANNHFADSMDDDLPEHEEKLVRFPTECIDTMPSVMREAFDWVIESAIKPQPELTLGALIALFGAVFGRRVDDDYGTRTNVMVLGLAPSGCGKEHPRQCNKLLLSESGLDAINGPERIGSHAGIISSISHYPVRLFQLDEIGRLLATMRDPKASHLYNIGTVLMALYSSSNTTWTGDAYADLAKVKKVVDPHVCVFGTSVPESLYSGLSPDNLTDGLVGRLLVFESQAIPDRRKPVRGGTPWRVAQTLSYWGKMNPGENAGFKPSIIRATKTPEADALHEDYCDKINSRHRCEDHISSAIWSRAPEKAGKLALIYAACESVNDSVTINEDAVAWAKKITNYSTRLVLQAARNAVSGSRYESDLKFVFNAIDCELTASQLTRRTQKLKRKDRVEILLDLENSGAIERVEVPSATNKKVVFRRKRSVL